MEETKRKKGLERKKKTTKKKRKQFNSCQKLRKVGFKVSPRIFCNDGAALPFFHLLANLGR